MKVSTRLIGDSIEQWRVCWAEAGGIVSHHSYGVLRERKQGGENDDVVVGIEHTLLHCAVVFNVPVVNLHSNGSQ